MQTLLKTLMMMHVHRQAISVLRRQDQVCCHDYISISLKKLIDYFDCKVVTLIEDKQKRQ